MVKFRRALVTILHAARINVQRDMQMIGPSVIMNLLLQVILRGYHLQKLSARRRPARLMTDTSRCRNNILIWTLNIRNMYLALNALARLFFHKLIETIYNSRQSARYLFIILHIMHIFMHGCIFFVFMYFIYIFYFFKYLLYYTL